MLGNPFLSCFFAKGLKKIQEEDKENSCIYLQYILEAIVKWVDRQSKNQKKMEAKEAYEIKITASEFIAEFMIASIIQWEEMNGSIL